MSPCFQDSQAQRASTGGSGGHVLSSLAVHFFWMQCDLRFIFEQAFSTWPGGHVMDMMKFSMLLFNLTFEKSLIL